MTLIVRLPDSLRPERAYAAHIVFDVHLGIEHELVFEPREDVLVHAAGESGRTLTIPDGVFRAGDTGWPANAARPASVSMVMNNDGPVTAEARSGSFGVDLFGIVFWYLTRLEEVLSVVRDSHGRFPASASQDENQRPCIDELTDLFGSFLLRLWPALRLRQHRSELAPTHDVDRPFKHLFQSRHGLLKGMARDALRHGGVAAALRSPLVRGRVRRGQLALDPFNTFDWLMDQSERVGNKSTFYFICSDRDGVDGDYRIDDPRIKALLRRIHSRGHAIGLHGTYRSAFDVAKLAAEVLALRQACESEHIPLDTIRARQHVLRFDPAKTPDVWAGAGIDEDSTIGHAGRAGFRCGTCRAFPLFAVGTRSMLKVLERPLVAMDATLLEPKYEDLSHEAATLRIEDLARRCQTVGGSFVLLWHNCRLEDAAARATYSRALGLAATAVA